MELSDKDTWGIHITLMSMRDATDSISMWNEGCLVVSNGAMWLDYERFYSEDILRHNRALVSYMEWHELILKSGFRDDFRQIETYYITLKGTRVIDDGGFQKYYKQKTVEAAAENEHQLMIKKKEIFEARLAEWQVKAFWPLFFFGTIGGIYAIMQIMQSLMR